MATFKSQMHQRFISGGALSALRLVLGFIRAKYMAITLGTAGIGIFAQINQFQLVAITLSSLSLGNGIVNRTRSPERLGKENLFRDTIGTAFTSIFFLSIIALIANLLLRKQIQHHIFQDQLSLTNITILSLAVPMSVLANGFLDSILVSHDKYMAVIKAFALATSFEFVYYIFFIHQLSLPGIPYAVFLSSFTLCAFYFIYLAKLKIRPKDFLIFHFSKPELKFLLHYSFTISSYLALGYVVNLVIRTSVMKYLGPEQNGLLQVPLALSAYTLPFITDGLWGHLRPRIASAGNSKEGHHELERVMSLVLCLSAFCSIGIMTAPEFIIKVVYTKSFTDAAMLFPVQFTADFFYFIFFSYSVFFLSASEYKSFLKIWLAYYSINALIVFFLLKKMNLLAMPIAHCTASIIVCTASYFFFNKRHCFERKTKQLFLGICVALFTSFFLLETHQSIYLRLIWSAITLPCVYFFYKKSVKVHAEASEG